MKWLKNLFRKKEYFYFVSITLGTDVQNLYHFNGIISTDGVLEYSTVELMIEKVKHDFLVDANFNGKTIKDNVEAVNSNFTFIGRKYGKKS